MISLIFSSLRMSNAFTEVDSEDEYEEFSRIMSPNLPYFEEIKGDEGGNGCYFGLESNMSITISVVNSTNREHIAEDEKWESLYDFWEREDLYFEFILPYDDNFYIVMYNNDEDGVASVSGYVAKDTSFDNYEVIGTYDRDHVDIGEPLNFQCVIDNRFGLERATLVVDGDLLEEFDNGKDMDMFNDSITLNYTIYPNEIKRYDVEIRLYDYAGNMAFHNMIIIGDEINIINTTTVDVVGYFDLIDFFEDNFIIIMTIGIPVAIMIGIGAAYVTEEN